MGSGDPARRAVRSSGLDLVARLGLLCWGLTHLLVAWLAASIAVGRPAAEGDQAGAMAVVGGKPWGVLALAAAAVGFAALTAWQVLETTVGHRAESGTSRGVERLMSAARSVGYGLLAWTAAGFALGAGKSKADQQQTLTAQLLAAPGGRWLVAAGGLVVLAGAVALAVYGITGRFVRHLRHAGPGVRLLGQVGYVTKGLAYGVAGVLVVAAAVTFDPGKSRGLDAALRTLAGQPYGRVLLLLVALGLAVYGVFGLVQVRLRKI